MSGMYPPTIFKNVFDVGLYNFSIISNLFDSICALGELKSKTVFSEMALEITLSSIVTAEIFNRF